MNRPMNVEELKLDSDLKEAMLHSMIREAWVMVWYRRFQFAAYASVILACLKYLATN